MSNSMVGGGFQLLHIFKMMIDTGSSKKMQFNLGILYKWEGGGDCRVVQIIY